MFKMATYIKLHKSPSSPDERIELLKKIAEEEDRFVSIGLSQLQGKMVDFLIDRKGYSVEDIEVNERFKVNLPDITISVNGDIIVRANGRIFLMIKCAMNSIDSWERYSIAFCRVVEPYQIPYAVVTNGESVRVLDVIKGSLISDDFDAIPTKEDAIKILKNIVFSPCAQDKCVKEKRILHAFEAIRCVASTDKD